MLWGMGGYPLVHLKIFQIQPWMCWKQWGALIPEEKSQPHYCQSIAPGLQNAEPQLVLPSLILQNWVPREQMQTLLVCWYACIVWLEKWCIRTGLKYDPPTTRRNKKKLFWCQARDCYIVFTALCSTAVGKRLFCFQRQKTWNMAGNHWAARSWLQMWDPPPSGSWRR